MRTIFDEADRIKSDLFASKQSYGIPCKLLNKMLGQLPGYVWFDTYITFLAEVNAVDASSALEICKRLEVNSVLLGKSINYSRVFVATRFRAVAGQIKRICNNNGYNVTIIVYKDLDDLVRKLGNMKFDVVVGNPPFQHNKSKGNKLWPKFIWSAVIDLVVDYGYVLLVTPNGWGSGGNNIPGNKGIIKDLFSENQVLLVDTTSSVNDSFDVKISIDMGFFLLKKEPVYTDTKIITDTGELFIKFLPTTVLGNRFTTLDISILNKFYFNDDQTNRIPFDVTSFDKKIPVSENESKFPTIDIQKKHYVLGGSDDNSAVFTYLKNSNSPALEYNKVVFTIGNRYWQPYYDFESLPVVCQGFAIKLPEDCSKQSLSSIFNSKLFRYVCWYHQLVLKGFMKTNMVYNLPYLDMSKTWTDEELYQYFNLTTDEIVHIEKAVEEKSVNCIFTNEENKGDFFNQFKKEMYDPPTEDTRVFLVETISLRYKFTNSAGPRLRNLTEEQKNDYIEIIKEANKNNNFVIFYGEDNIYYEQPNSEWINETLYQYW